MSSVREIPTEVAIGPADGMARQCAINFDNTFTLRIDRCLERITIAVHREDGRGLPRVSIRRRVLSQWPVVNRCSPDRRRTTCITAAMHAEYCYAFDHDSGRAGRDPR